MEIITRLVGGLGLIYILYNVFYIWRTPSTEKYVDERGYPRTRDKELTVINNIFERKPFNCLVCISSWVSIGLSIWYLDIFYLSLALIYYILNSKL